VNFESARWELYESPFRPKNLLKLDDRLNFHPKTTRYKINLTTFGTTLFCWPPSCRMPKCRPSKCQLPRCRPVKLSNFQNVDWSSCRWYGIKCRTYLIVLTFVPDLPSLTWLLPNTCNRLSGRVASSVGLLLLVVTKPSSL
jgi:hypothetical protein